MAELHSEAVGGSAVFETARHSDARQVAWKAGESAGARAPDEHERKLAGNVLASLLVKGALATPEHVAAFEARRTELEAKAANELTGAQARAARLEGFALTITAKAGNEGKLFGSIGTADIAEACQKAGQDIQRSEVRLPGGPLRMVGEHTVTLHLHADVDVTLPVTIVAEE